VVSVSHTSDSLLLPGAQDVTSIDFSPPCIEQMRARNAGTRPSLRFLVADATALALEEGSFDVALEKGLLDAMVCAPGSSAAAGVAAMMDGVVHALAPGGVFVLISYGPPAERLKWVDPQRRGLTTDVWTLLKPGALGQAAGADGGSEEGGAAEQQPQRFSPGDEADGKRHFIYVFTKQTT
jgi:SAM-dependent methyltransferase